MIVFNFFFLISIIMFCVSGAGAEEVTVDQTVSKAIVSNPDIQAKWHAFQASDKELSSAKGGFLPKLDLTAGLGRETLDGEGYDGRDMLNYTRDGVYVSLNQMIYDGNFTYSQSKKYSHSKKMRYFNLISTIEQTAVAALRSHEDVLRYRVLVEKAKGNLDRHQAIMDKIEERTNAGVDSKVNLETTKGRLSLARVNLITEESNLYDSITQYVKVVGNEPDPSLKVASITLELPLDSNTALEEAIAENPQLSAYRENVKSMFFAIDEQKSKMQPRVDLRASTNFEHDVDGVDGRRDKGVIELIMRYNLYNGGTDRANIQKYIELHKEAQENMNKTERDIAQSVLIAYNDIQNIQKQLPDLKQHMKSADNTRIVYGKQFEAGRRSLLDLLDAENEYFQADRAYANAEFNLTIAKGNYLAARGQLLKYFGIMKDDVSVSEKIGIHNPNTVNEPKVKK